jgi:hypothetical protein
MKPSQRDVRPELGRRASKGFSAKSRIEGQAGLNWPLVPWLMPIVVALLAFSAFLPGLQNGFLFWDDHLNFLENPHYRGLGWAQLRWMFTTFHEGHYQPLSWLTLGLDYLVWGMNPFGYHLTNLFPIWLISRPGKAICKRRSITSGERFVCSQISLKLMRAKAGLLPSKG